VILPGAIKDP